MLISNTMDLGALAERMGDVATTDEARAMRALLVTTHDGQDTQDVSEAEWNRLLTEAASAA